MNELTCSYFITDVARILSRGDVTNQRQGPQMSRRSGTFVGDEGCFPELLRCSVNRRG